MNAISVLNGLLYTYRPGTFVTWSAEDIEDAPNLAGDRTLTLIGQAEGGQPLAPYIITSPAQARAVLRGGELLDAALLAFNSAGQGGLTIIAVNVLGGTQAALDIPDAVSGTFGTLTSAAFRERANQTRFQVFGDTTNGYTVTVNDADTGYTLSGFNIGLGLRLSYIGTQATAATAQVVMVNGTKRLVTEITGAEADNVSIALTDTTTITDVIRLLQASGPYVASQGRDPQLSASTLDVTTAPADLKAANPVLFTAIAGDFTRFFAVSGNGEVSFTPSATATAPASNFSGIFSGAATIPTKADDWAKAMQVINRVATAIIVPLTADQVIISGLRGELALRNGPLESNFTTMIAGYDDARLPLSNSTADVNNYIAQVGADLAVINDYQTQIICNTGDATLPASGLRGRMPMYMTAAIYAGEIMGNGINNSGTYKYVALSNPFPVLDLNQSNVMVQRGAVIFEQPVAAGPVRVVRDRTTYTATDNPVYESGMSVRTMNSIARGFKALQDRFIPGAASAKRLADFQSAANDYFDARVEIGDLTGDGVDGNGQPVPPYTFTLQRTTNGGRRVVSSSRVVPKSEFVVGEHTMVARSVEFQVSSNA